MTPTDVAELVDAAPLPPGYHLVISPQRQHKYRSLWAARVLDSDGNRLWGKAAYNPAALIRMAQKWAWEQVRGVIVTTDAQGWVTSIDDA